MLFGLIGRVSSANQLKQGLDVGSQRARAIAARVSQATLQNADGFALPVAGAAPGTVPASGVDVEAEMAGLADEQLRYEATARLLQKAYAQVRTSIKDR